jgi:hypothetical protein
MSRACPFYYEDSHRRAPRKECRLMRRHRASAAWDEKLCRSCPVPDILEQNPCANLALQGEVKSRFGFWRRVVVFAVCTVDTKEIADPKTCGRGCEHFEGLS